MRHARHGRGCLRRVRASIVTVVALAPVAAPGPAAAHSRAPTVALDYRLSASEASRALRGVRVELVDGDRALRLRAEPGVELVVRGLLGEPVLRFARSGVWVNGRSPTAASDRLLRRGEAGSGWIRRTSGHGYTWHDHRLAPPPGLPAGSVGRWSVPISVDGRGTRIGGTFVRVARPALWPWLVGAAALGAAIVLAAWRRPRARGLLAAGLGAIATAGALTANTSFATASGAHWVQVGAAALLALAVVAALCARPRSARPWISTMVGVVAAAMSFGSLGVLWHGVVISSLPAPLVRAATALAVVAGSAAAVLGVVADDEQPRRAPARPRAVLPR